MTDHQKLRGGYYTPQSIADFLATWAIRTPTDVVLEPSCGDGMLVLSAAQRLMTLGRDPHFLRDQIVGVELDEHEAAKAASRIHAIDPALEPLSIHQGDFFAYCRQKLLRDTVLTGQLEPSRRFDAIIGNPPFIRYQNFPEEYREIAFQIMEQAGFHPNRLTNAWLPFLVVSTLLLSEHGRIAMVIPAELFQVSYAAELRRFLSDYFSRLTILTFRELVFPDIQQDVVLFLGEHNGNTDPEIQVYELNNASDLADFWVQERQPEFKPMDHSSEKWTQYFLTRDEITLLRKLREHPRIAWSNQVIDVDVGVVTGQNDFFILKSAEVADRGLEPMTRRIVARSGHLKGAIFTQDDWLWNANEEYGSYLFAPPDVEREALPQAAQELIGVGEAQKMNIGFKCRIRKRWYIVPSVWVPDAFMLRQIHGYPKLILNVSGATCTDTIHRVRFVNGADPRMVTAAFLNSLTFAFAEVTGRGYGGGVLTFEPSEAEHLPIPLEHAQQLDLDHIDQLLRHDKIEAVLEITDEELLVRGLGLSHEEAAMLRRMWVKLRDRRINRKHKASRG